MTDRETLKHKLTSMNEKQLALNGKFGYGLWQDMTPHIDEITDMMAKPEDPHADLKAAVQYFLNEYGGQRDDTDKA